MNVRWCGLILPHIENSNQFPLMVDEHGYDFLELKECTYFNVPINGWTWTQVFEIIRDYFKIIEKKGYVLSKTSRKIPIQSWVYFLGEGLRDDYPLGHLTILILVLYIILQIKIIVLSRGIDMLKKGKRMK